MKIVIISAVWCPSCLVMNKIWKQIKEDYPNLGITKYDYDIDEDIVKNYNVGNILPVYIFLNDKNEEFKRIEGETSYEEICEVINS